MPNIDRTYLLIALVMLVLGEMLGLYMGIANDLRHKSPHVAMVLPGTVILGFYGFIYRLWPELKTAPLARAQFWVSVVGAFALVAGAYHYAFAGGTLIAGPASLIAIGGAALMLLVFWKHSR
jgi:hypothetical protein